MSDEILRYSGGGTLTIANGANTPSTSIDLRRHAGVSLILPSEFDGTNIGWQGSDDGTTFYDYWEEGVVYAETVQASVIVSMPAGLFAAKYVRPKTGTNQGGSGTVLTYSFKT